MEEIVQADGRKGFDVFRMIVTDVAQSIRMLLMPAPAQPSAAIVTWHESVALINTQGIYVYLVCSQQSSVQYSTCSITLCQVKLQNSTSALNILVFHHDRPQHSTE